MSDHSSSSDEDLEDMLDVVEIPKNVDYFQKTVPLFSVEQYMEHFRLRPEKTEELVHLFATSQYYNWQEGDALKVSALKCITVFLWFASDEAVSFRDVSDRFNITKSTLFKIIRRVTVFLNNLSQEVITWPTDAEKKEIEVHFSANNFTGVIGVIDGTHIRIFSSSVLFVSAWFCNLVR
ncbi:hypothetical protein WA026_002978 [Henosepilachna vigintioctopunctata]|uniref:Nuclease HARBI1 n=1 Tax=Henosepilachna vigintioctopunctata TaxID=420089 RepID=A0AAW1TM55_9CUCU